MMSGGGRLSKLPEAFHVLSSSLKSSISSVSSWNCEDVSSWPLKKGSRLRSTYPFVHLAGAIRTARGLDGYPGI